MQIHTHPIASEEHIAAYQLTTLHFGTPGARPKVYIQASLHADEVPAMLVAHTLRKQLEQLDSEGKIPGEIILVPSANPIGLSHRWCHRARCKPRPRFVSPHNLHHQRRVYYVRPQGL